MASGDIATEPTDSGGSEKVSFFFRSMEVVAGIGLFQGVTPIRGAAKRDSRRRRPREEVIKNS
jgi:hypothetical protein